MTRTVYGELVVSGYQFGLAGFPFPADEPIGSAWAHGYRLGRNVLLQTKPTGVTNDQSDRDRT